eukprot:360793-Chlamydomonas_euryale.AAC.3
MPRPAPQAPTPLPLALLLPPAPATLPLPRATLLPPASQVPRSCLAAAVSPPPHVPVAAAAAHSASRGGMSAARSPIEGRLGPASHAAPPPPGFAAVARRRAGDGPWGVCAVAAGHSVVGRGATPAAGRNADLGAAACAAACWGEPMREKQAQGIGGGLDAAHPDDECDMSSNTKDPRKREERWRRCAQALPSQLSALTACALFDRWRLHAPAAAVDDVRIIKERSCRRRPVVALRAPAEGVAAHAEKSALAGISCSAKRGGRVCLTLLPGHARQRDITAKGRLDVSTLPLAGDAFPRTPARNFDRLRSP